MTQDVEALDLLPASPATPVLCNVSDLALNRCEQTCTVSCFGQTCSYTDNRG